MERNEILGEITRLQLERDERLGDYISHSLDLSDEFECVRASYSSAIRDLQALLVGAGKRDASVAVRNEFHDTNFRLDFKRVVSSAGGIRAFCRAHKNLSPSTISRVLQKRQRGLRLETVLGVCDAMGKSVSDYIVAVVSPTEE